MKSASRVTAVTVAIGMASFMYQQIAEARDRRFYARYPAVVAGMALVESSHENQGGRVGAVDWRFGLAMLIKVAVRRQAWILGVRRLAASLGLMRRLDAIIAREAPPSMPGRTARSYCQRARGAPRSGNCSWRQGCAGTRPSSARSR